MDTTFPYPAIRLPEGSWWDWDVLASDSGAFRPAAGPDLTYGHGRELLLRDPAFVSCPTAFHDPVFRAPTPEEPAAVTRHRGEQLTVLVAFEADAHGPEPGSCVVAAERLEIMREHVLRYWRDDAPPGQRFAPWVRPAAHRTGSPAAAPGGARTGRPRIRTAGPATPTD
ncbi:hypothetical protein [Streptomyces coffeae]|uniref:Uncharacterized protein n=1 Tax=Streptomyces coffeae TaxID=621382 RepID=A0ABS1NK61_9ACTN|nr:hypothetical protein [Streptomyces coffeae]MBL1100473.1 hypothetical protein [Streptomyces coffeae]